jgi:hypothetical protein
LSFNTKSSLNLSTDLLVFLGEVEQVAITWARAPSAKRTTPPAASVGGRADWSPVARVSFTSHLFKNFIKPAFGDKYFDVALVAHQNKKEGK